MPKRLVLLIIARMGEATPKDGQPTNPAHDPSSPEFLPFGKKLKKKEAWTGDWRGLGMVRKPSSHQTGVMAKSARKIMAQLTCFAKAHDMLAAGRSPADVAGWVATQEKALPCKPKTLQKYIELYKAYYITTADKILARAIVEKVPPPPPPGHEVIGTDPRQRQMGQLGRKLSELVEGVREINQINDLLDMQLDRIRDARAFEKTLGGMTVPTFYKEVEAAEKLFRTAVQIKQDLGVYPRVPKTLDIRNMTPSPDAQVRERVRLMTDTEKTAMVELGEYLENLGTRMFANEQEGEVIEVAPE